MFLSYKDQSMFQRIWSGSHILSMPAHHQVYLSVLQCSCYIIDLLPFLVLDDMFIPLRHVPAIIGNMLYGLLMIQIACIFSFSFGSCTIEFSNTMVSCESQSHRSTRRLFCFVLFLIWIYILIKDRQFSVQNSIKVNQQLICSSKHWRQIKGLVCGHIVSMSQRQKLNSDLLTSSVP